MKNTILERSQNGKFTLIAEIGVNYYDIANKFSITPMEAAKLMIKEAKSAGIHAVKFQSYKAASLAAKESPSYWDTKEENTTSQFELFQKYDGFSYVEYKELADYCVELDIEFLSTAFDIQSADYLDELMNVYKISSSDLNNIPFIEYQAKKQKPIIISTGASNADEIDRAINSIRKYNKSPIILMHCVLEYPTPYEHANLNKITSLKERYSDLIIGYSDHTRPDEDSEVIKTAYNLGAIVVEKHYTLDKELSGNDHYHAMNTSDAEKIISRIKFVDDLRGSHELKFSKSEEISRKNARRSIVSNLDINKGDIITEEMLTFKRPGNGIPPSEIDKVLGEKSLIDIKENTIIQYDMVTNDRNE